MICSLVRHVELLSLTIWTYSWSVSTVDQRYLSYKRVAYFLFVSQACLREIHASLLRKHLHRLENAGAPEQAVEADEESDTKEEDVMHDDEGSDLLMMS